MVTNNLQLSAYVPEENTFGWIDELGEINILSEIDSESCLRFSKSISKRICTCDNRLNYNEEDNIIYIGTNNKTGLRIYLDSNKTDCDKLLCVSMVINNENIFEGVSEIKLICDLADGGYSNAYLEYLKTENGLIFGFSTNIYSSKTIRVIEYAIGKDKDMDNNDINYYAHIISNSSYSSTNLAAPIHFITDDNKYKIINFNERKNIRNASSFMAILTPLFIEENRYVSNYLYTAECLSNTMNGDFIFTLNNKTYVHLNLSTTAATPEYGMQHLVVRMEPYDEEQTTTP